MATFSINQVRHLYVTNAVKSGKVDLKAEVGTLFPQADKKKENLYFQYIGAGGPAASDRIKISNIEYAKATKSEDLAKKLNRFEVVLNKDVNMGKPLVGQDYVLRLAFRQYIGLGEEDQYLKHGVVHGMKDMSASDFYKTMAISLVRAMKRDLNSLVNVYVKTDSDVLVEPGQKIEDITGEAKALVLEEVAQDWRHGIIKEEVIPFTPQTLTVPFEGFEYLWGDVKKVESVNSIPNGKITADLEHFCMGARGDVYRGVKYPYNITTTYLVDPSKKYDTLDIHYSFVGDGVSTQKSEKDITFVTEDDGSHTIMNALIAEINKVSGLKIETL